MSRRRFLQLSAEVATGVAVGVTAHVVAPELRAGIEELASWKYDETFHLRYKDALTFDFDIARQIAERFTHLKHIMTTYLLPATLEAVRAWMDEAAPFFSYNGIFETVRLPSNLEIEKTLDGLEHLYTAGSSNCKQTIRVSNRFFNPYSSWSDSPTFPAVITHELDHIEQGDACNVDPFYGEAVIEEHAQVATYEVLASMARDGNRIATTALVAMIQQESLHSCYSLAAKEGRMEEFAVFLQGLYPDAGDRAFFEQEMDTIRQKNLNPENVFDLYSVNPLSDIVAGYLKDGNFHETNLLSIESEYGGHGRNQVHRFAAFPLDDFLYFMKYAEDFVAS